MPQLRDFSPFELLVQSIFTPKDLSSNQKSGKLHLEHFKQITLKSLSWLNQLSLRFHQSNQQDGVIIE